MANNILDDNGQRLLILTRQGNHEAFGKLYDKYAPMVMGFVINFGCDKKTAEEVLQQVFNKIWEQKTVVDSSKEPLFTKMIKIARTTVKEICIGKINLTSEISQANKRVYVNGMDKQLSKQNDAEGPALLFNIEKTSKEALDLIYFNGYSLSDAATVLNIPLGSLIEKVKIAVRQLKEAAIL
jgi:RNA polymerase sigma-70 factor (ECF subfamily)